MWQVFLCKTRIARKQNNMMPGCNQGPDKGSTDEAGTTGDKNFHESIFFQGGLRRFDPEMMNRVHALALMSELGLVAFEEWEASDFFLHGWREHDGFCLCFLLYAKNICLEVLSENLLGSPLLRGIELL